MPPLYLMEQGSQLRVERQRLLVQKSGELLVRVPLAHVESVLIYGNIGGTTPAIKRLMSAGVDVVFLTTRGQYVGRMVGPLSKFGELRAAQYRATGDMTFALSAARRIVQGKLFNLRVTLQRRQRENAALGLTATIERLAQLSARAGQAEGLAALLGLEGSASAAYFGVFGRLVPEGWRFTRRTRRPPADPVNVLLSLGYTLLTRQVESAVSAVGLDPYLGLLHQPVYGRPSLALDIVEEFRAPIVDAVVLRCLNEGMIAPGDFTPGPSPDRPVVLSQGGMKSFIQAFETKLVAEVYHPETRERVSYRRAAEVQARVMARCFRSGVPDYTPFRLR